MTIFAILAVVCFALLSVLVLILLSQLDAADHDIFTLHTVVEDLREQKRINDRFVDAYTQVEGMVWECERDCSADHEPIPQWCEQWRDFIEQVRKTEDTLRQAEQ